MIAPEPTLESVRRRLNEFIHQESSSGKVLMATALLALLAANSPLNAMYDALLEIPLEIKVGSLEIAKPLLLWINDGLMAVFFFLVGLELEREILEGHLSSFQKAALPGIAAVGGMAIPAAFYAFLNWGDAAAMKGWAIPTATDIAFALGVLALLGDRVPTSLKALLLSIAIFDDLGAIIVIALFYTADLSTESLIVAAVMLVLLFVLNRKGVQRPAAYILLGIPLWIAVLKSGVHATLAGVALAMFIPLRSKGKSENEGTDEHSHSMLHNLEHTLHPWVAFGVLPIFAFANAGVPLGGISVADITHPVPMGIVLGLFVGKQIGVFGFCWVAKKLGLAQLPEGVTWGQLYGTSFLCGIGFTMSLFIASLAFEAGATEYLGLDRLGILMGSLISGLVGFVVLKRSLRNAPAVSE